MSANDNKFIRTSALLDALKERIAALEYTAGVPLFEKVEPYPSSDLLKAIADLRAYNSRVCVIVPSADEFTTEIQGSELKVKGTREFVLLMTDQEYTSGKGALVGTDKVIGLINIKDSLEEQMTAQNLNFNPRLIRLVPLGGSSIQSIKPGEARGRIAWQMSWRAEAGDRLFTVR